MAVADRRAGQSDDGRNNPKSGKFIKGQKK
jgi:hypothetical protein